MRSNMCCYPLRFLRKFERRQGWQEKVGTGIEPPHRQRTAPHGYLLNSIPPELTRIARPSLRSGPASLIGDIEGVWHVRALGVYQGGLLARVLVTPAEAKPSGRNPR
jgi:hypothetical protein